MLDRVSNRVAIIDFGLAAMKGVSTLPMQSRGASFSIAGSPAWFAPEFHVAQQLPGLIKEGKEETSEVQGLMSMCGDGFARSPAIDIWGAGTVLLHLLLGKWGDIGTLGDGAFQTQEKPLSLFWSERCTRGVGSSTIVFGMAILHRTP